MQDILYISHFFKYWILFCFWISFIAGEANLFMPIMHLPFLKYLCLKRVFCKYSMYFPIFFKSSIVINQFYQNNCYLFVAYKNASRHSKKHSKSLWNVCLFWPSHISIRGWVIKECWSDWLLWLCVDSECFIDEKEGCIIHCGMSSVARWPAYWYFVPVCCLELFCVVLFDVLHWYSILVIFHVFSVWV